MIFSDDLNVASARNRGNAPQLPAFVLLLFPTAGLYTSSSPPTEFDDHGDEGTELNTVLQKSERDEESQQISNTKVRFWTLGKSHIVGQPAMEIGNFFRLNDVSPIFD
ncbi:hypothetical protein AXG93_4776s1170 [Marchantia polymorpha subsp. ruderalis]|uniref:Uncharacterized protein n=1 Tax=Marchantia polymorpha subsp. ruderalis TaxID=1480154 RepID=A0A176VTK3_MARPO|nr:hypothetical protein AXG93_4776s1170 [Marchantia polymorpha subsp. ruderalis]